MSATPFAKVASLMLPEPLRIFIGYDSREPIAYHVLAHSIISRATRPVTISPVAVKHLDFYTRQRGARESTEFSITRFLVPYLSGYKGHSIFMDCDMLCLTDITNIWLEIGGQLDKAVLVCQHDYTSKTFTKFLGQSNSNYPRKNWSSFMVFNNAKCKVLTPDYANTASGLDLHRFNWLKDEEIGSLPLEWNWLVGEYNKNPNAKFLHYTLGGPWFRDCEDCDYADEWFNEFQQASVPTPIGVTL